MLIRTNPASVILERGPSELQVSIDEESFLGKVGPVAQDGSSAQYYLLCLFLRRRDQEGSFFDVWSPGSAYLEVLRFAVKQLFL